MEQPEIVSPTDPMKIKNIYQRIIDVQLKVESVFKDDKISMGGETYSAVTHDMVTKTLHRPLAEAGIVAVPTQISCLYSSFETTKPGYKPVDPPRVTHWYRTEIHAKVTFVNVDDPKDFFESQAFAYALDTSDKGPSKAYSLALKMIHLKTFFLESKDKEEERSFESYQDDDGQKKKSPPAPPVRNSAVPKPLTVAAANPPAPPPSTQVKPPATPPAPSAPTSIADASAEPPPKESGPPAEEPEWKKLTRMIYAVAKKNKWSQEDANRAMKDAFGLESSKDITWVFANELKKLMEIGLSPDKCIETIKLSKNQNK